MAAKFEFPAHFDFAPMFTLQPNMETRKKQMQLWQDIILAYCTHRSLMHLVSRFA